MCFSYYICVCQPCDRPVTCQGCTPPYRIVNLWQVCLTTKMVGWKWRRRISRDRLLMLVLQWLYRIFYASCGIQPAPASHQVSCTALIHFWSHDACVVASACDWLLKLNFIDIFADSLQSSGCLKPALLIVNVLICLDHLFDYHAILWHSSSTELHFFHWKHNSHKLYS